MKHLKPIIRKLESLKEVIVDLPEFNENQVLESSFQRLNLIMIDLETLQNAL